MPRPPCDFSSVHAPICVASRPATSLIGASSGRRPLSSSTVSYATAATPLVDERARERLVGREVQVREEDEIGPQPARTRRAIGSFTLSSRSAASQTSSTDTIRAPAAR